MSNRAKRLGTAAETAVAGYLRTHGHPLAERRALNGSTDKGDIAGVPGIVLEVKAHRADALPGWVDEAVIEAANAGVPVGVVVHRRYGTTDIGRWFVTMTLEMFCALTGDTA